MLVNGMLVFDPSSWEGGRTQEARLEYVGLPVAFLIAVIRDKSNICRKRLILAHVGGLKATAEDM